MRETGETRTDLYHGPIDAIDGLALVTSFYRGQEIYRREDPAQHWYRVVSGAARECALLANGRRQIIDFLLPGDVFGYADKHHHPFSAEAIVEGTVVARYPRRHVERMADSDPRVGRLVREMAFKAVSRLEARMVILGRMTALEKVASFLLEMAERSSDHAAETVLLPMSRYDIGDFLALAAETVSRTLTEFKHRGAIRFVDLHRVRIIDRDALVEVSDDADRW